MSSSRHLPVYSIHDRVLRLLAVTDATPDKVAIATFPGRRGPGSFTAKIVASYANPLLLAVPAKRGRRFRDHSTWQFHARAGIAAGRTKRQPIFMPISNTRSRYV